MVCFGHLKHRAGQKQREMLGDSWVYRRKHYSRQGTDLGSYKWVKREALLKKKKCGYWSGKKGRVGKCRVGISHVNWMPLIC